MLFNILNITCDVQSETLLLSECGRCSCTMPVYYLHGYVVWLTVRRWRTRLLIYTVPLSGCDALFSVLVSLDTR